MCDNRNCPMKPIGPINDGTMLGNEWSQPFIPDLWHKHTCGECGYYLDLCDNNDLCRKHGHQLITLDDKACPSFTPTLEASHE